MITGNLPWWLQLEGDLLIIAIIVAMVILLAIVICCIVIWLVCRRKRAQAKCKYLLVPYFPHNTLESHGKIIKKIINY